MITPSWGSAACRAPPPARRRRRRGAAEQLRRSCGGTAAAKAASTESSRHSTKPRRRRAPPPPSPPPPLACFVLRRLRRLDSVLGAIAVDLKQFQFQVRSAAACAAGVTEVTRNRPNRFLKARSLATFRLFNFSVQYCNYRDVLRQRCLPCWRKGIERFKTAARAQACQPCPAVTPP